MNKKRDDKKRKRAEEEEKSEAEANELKLKPQDASTKGKDELEDAPEAKKARAGDASQSGDAPESKKAKIETADDQDGAAAESVVPDVPAATHIEAAEVRRQQALFSSGTSHSC